MPGVRRSQLAVDAAERNQEQRLRIGAEILTMRERRAWTRIGARPTRGHRPDGRRAGSKRGATNLDLEVLQRIGVGLGTATCSSRSGGTSLEGPTDAGHLAIQELVLRLGSGRRLLRAHSSSQAGQASRGARSTSVSPIQHENGCSWSNAGTPSAMSEPLRGRLNGNAPISTRSAAGRWGPGMARSASSGSCAPPLGIGR